MTLGIVGRKCGMTRVFTPEGKTIPVTVVEAIPNRVTQLRTMETDGYTAVQVTFGRRLSNVTKPMAGHFAKAKVEAGAGLWEFRLMGEVDLSALALGSEVKVDIFTPGQKVDVRGVSKGKGFQGGVKRHNFRTQDATHGNSLSHRVLGSVGQNQSPGRVFKGKKMAGHLGHENCAVQNLEVVRVDNERHLLLIKGAIPGSSGGKVVIIPAVKTKQARES